MKEGKILILGGSSFVGRHLTNALDKNSYLATDCSMPVNEMVHFDSLKHNFSTFLKQISPVKHAVLLLGDTQPDSCFLNKVKSNKIKVSKLGQGLPVGGEIEQLDDGTLVSAFKNRVPVSSD